MGQAFDELTLVRTLRRLRHIRGSLLESVRKWVDCVDVIEETEDVLVLAFMRHSTSVVVEDDESRERAAPVDRAALDRLREAAAALDARLRAMPVPRPLLDEAVEEMLARTELALGRRSRARRLIAAAKESDYPPAMMAALEAIYGLDQRQLGAIESIPADWILRRPKAGGA